MAVQLSEGAKCLAAREKDCGTNLSDDEMRKLIESVFGAPVPSLAAWCTCGKPCDGLSRCDEQLHSLVDNICSAAGLFMFCEMPLADKCRTAGCKLRCNFQRTISLMLSEKLARMAAKAELVLPDWVTEYEPLVHVLAEDVHEYLAYFFEHWLSDQTIKSYQNTALALELASFSGGASRWARVKEIIDELLASREPVEAAPVTIARKLENVTTFDELLAVCCLPCDDGSVVGRELEYDVACFLELKLAAAPSSAGHVGDLVHNLEWKLQCVLASIARNCARETDRKRPLSSTKGSARKKARKN
jgi:hypothetical protein